MKRTFTQSISGLLRSKKSLTIRFAAVLGVFALSATQAMAQFLEVPANAMATSNIYKGPSTAFLGFTTPDPTLNVQRTAALYPAAEVSAFAANTNITSIGFQIDSAAATVVTGNMKIYLVNTTNTTFTRNAGWNTLLAAPTAMTLVFDDSVAIPASKGFYDITLTTPFNYTGDGLYLAYEWEADLSSKATFDAIYRADNTLVNGARFGVGNTATKPGVLNNQSSFRPQIRLGGYTPLANDASVEAVYALGKATVSPATNPQTIEAVIINKGTASIANRTVTLRVTGANTFTANSSISSLASGDTATVYFSGFTPTTTGTNTISVTVPGDDRTSNDSVSVSQIVTQENISYATGNPPMANSAVGFTATNSGAFLTRYEVKNNTPVMIPTVRVFIGNGASPAGSPLIGKTVFAVVMDMNGGLLARSANKVLTGGDLDGMVDFQINGNPIVQNQHVLVGLAAQASATAYFPVGTQQETILRDSAYYAITGDTSFATPTAPLDLGAAGVNLGRFMIEAVFADPVGLKDNLLANNAVNVYPNPTSGRVQVTFAKEVKSNTVSFSVMNMQGQVVRRIGSMAVRPVNELNLSDLPAGVYMLQVNTDDATGIQRIVIQ